MANFGDIPANSSGQFPGTSTNDDAAAGNIGELIGTNNNGVSLSSGTPANVTSISITAGDWDISGNVILNYTSATQNADGKASFSTTSATHGGAGNEQSYDNTRHTTTTSKVSLSLYTRRLSLSSPATVYMVASTGFSAGSCTADGAFVARRVR